MDATKVRSVYDAHIRNLMWALCLNAWQINVRPEKLAENVAGQYRVDFEYRRASIAIDPDENETETDVLDTLFHELLHVALSAYCMPLNLARDLAHSSDATTGINEAFRNASELTVHQIEYAFKVGLGMNVKKISALGAKMRDAVPAKPKRRKRKKK